ncbi:unnamed protein product [Owenia fusiformis]|uniref:Uncharacterized protein n=1 Tax=Owenia fusiformis TaxID=6347 RepID=A0A8J1U6X8_OWEFU|nr:unnamed protein product [Owenia fusiformis]
MVLYYGAGRYTSLCTNRLEIHGNYTYRIHLFNYNGIGRYEEQIIDHQLITTTMLEPKDGDEDAMSTSLSTNRRMSRQSSANSMISRASRLHQKSAKLHRTPGQSVSSGVGDISKVENKNNVDPTTNQAETLITALPDDDQSETTKNLKASDEEPKTDIDLDDNDLYSEKGDVFDNEAPFEIDIENEADYDTDLEVDEEAFLKEDEMTDPGGKDDYVKMCKSLGVIPVSYFMRHIKDPNFTMKHHGLGSSGSTSIGYSLENNTKMVKVNLEDNFLTKNGAIGLAKHLKENMYITELTLSENNIGNDGAKALCEMLTENHVINKLNLSGNEFTCAAAEHFYKMLEHNTSLKHLVLSHNNLEERGAKIFKDILMMTESLESLDLSWNHIRMKGAVAISDGLKENIGLKTINLAWNGFGFHGAKAMGTALCHNRSLLDLDISANRIPTEGAMFLAKGLKVNDILQVLKLGQNPLDLPGPMAILLAVAKNDSSNLVYVDMTSIFVSEDFEEKQKELQKERAITVIHGGTTENKMDLSFFNNVSKAITKDPMGFLRDYCASRGYRLVDMFREFDKDQSMQVSREEFIRGVQMMGIPMRLDQIDDLITSLDKNGDGEIDYAELLSGDKEYLKAQKALQDAINKKDADRDEKKKESTFGKLLFNSMGPLAVEQAMENCILDDGDGDE